MFQCEQNLKRLPVLFFFKSLKLTAKSRIYCTFYETQNFIKSGQLQKIYYIPMDDVALTACAK